MIETKDFYYPSSNGTDRVHARLWLPETQTPKGVVQLVHGIVEHIGRYEDFARFLAGEGFVVAGEDHLGHGLTASGPDAYGYFADSDGWQHIVRDIRTLFDRLRADYPGLPCFLLGHSMGSFLARTFLIDCPEGLSGALICGTAQQSGVMISAGLALVALSRAQKQGLHCRSALVDSICFGAYNKKFAPNRTVCDWVCSDEAVVDAKLRDPAASFTPTLGAFRDMLRGIRYMQRRDNLARMDKALPVFFFGGELDPVGDMGKGVRAAYQSFLDAGCTDVALKLYPGDRHEVLNETDKAAVWQDVLRWITEKLPAAV